MNSWYDEFRDFDITNAIGKAVAELNFREIEDSPHNVPPKVRAKRRAANKQARRTRKANR